MCKGDNRSTTGRVLLPSDDRIADPSSKRSKGIINSVLSLCRSSLLSAAGPTIPVSITPEIVEPQSEIIPDVDYVGDGGISQTKAGFPKIELPSSPFLFIKKIYWLVFTIKALNILGWKNIPIEFER